MPRRLPSDRAEEIIYRLSRNKDFKEAVVATRLAFGIPAEGLSTDEGLGRWFRKLPTGRYGKFLGALQEILDEKKLPPGFDGWLEDFVLHAERLAPTSAHMEHRSFCEVDYERGRAVPYVHVRIYPGASQAIVKEAIERDWREIQAFLGGSRVRTTTKNRMRNDLILALWSKSRRELGLEKGDYKDARIAQMLREKFDIVVSPENVRKIASKAKSRDATV